jgi:hypothetical protein
MRLGSYLGFFYDYICGGDGDETNTHLVGSERRLIFRWLKLSVIWDMGKYEVWSQRNEMGQSPVCLGEFVVLDMQVDATAPSLLKDSLWT